MWVNVYWDPVWGPSSVETRVWFTLTWHAWRSMGSDKQPYNASTVSLVIEYLIVARVLITVFMTNLGPPSSSQGYLLEKSLGSHALSSAVRSQTHVCDSWKSQSTLVALSHRPAYFCTLTSWPDLQAWPHVSWGQRSQHADCVPSALQGHMGDVWLPVDLNHRRALRISTSLWLHVGLFIPSQLYVGLQNRGLLGCPAIRERFYA